MEINEKNVKNKGAGVRSRAKNRFSTRNIALMATFIALAFLVSLFDFPIFPAVPFLKLDFGNVFILLIGFLLGPLEGVIVCVCKETLRIFAGNTGGVGELANMLVTSAFILLPSIVYQFKKGLKIVVPSLVIACFLGTGAALVTNRFINFPLYMGEAGVQLFKDAFGFIVAFNLIKTASISVLTLLLYKRLSNFLRKNKNLIARETNICYNKGMDGFISSSREQTLEFAREYAKTLRAGDVVLLDGDMGAGKTVFAKGVAEGLGIDEEVTSPTYAYMNDYDGRLFHYDCYRIEAVEQAEALGLADYFDLGGICLIEWSQNIAPLLPKRCKRVRIEKIDEERRKIVVEGNE